MARVSFYEEISKNNTYSILLVVLISALVLGIVYAMSIVFVPGLVFILLSIFSVFIIVDVLSSYFYGDKLVLKASQAKKANIKEHRQLLNIVEGLSLGSGIPVPKVYVLESNDINAFATGRDPKHASIAVTTGALQKLKRIELEGVVAHEMSHIGNYDIRFMLLVGVFVGFAAILSEIFLRSTFYSGGQKDKGAGLILIAGLILAVVAPIAARLAQLAISRRREYLADASGAKLTRYPPGLASALEKIKYNKKNMNVSDALSHLFIDDPKKTFLDSIFETHPPIEKRIEKLKSM